MAYNMFEDYTPASVHNSDRRRDIEEPGPLVQSSRNEAQRGQHAVNLDEVLERYESGEDGKIRYGDVLDIIQEINGANKLSKQTIREVEEEIALDADEMLERDDIRNFILRYLPIDENSQYAFGNDHEEQSGSRLLRRKSSSVASLSKVPTPSAIKMSRKSAIGSSEGSLSPHTKFEYSPASPTWRRSASSHGAIERMSSRELLSSPLREEHSQRLNQSLQEQLAQTLQDLEVSREREKQLQSAIESHESDLDEREERARSLQMHQRDLNTRISALKEENRRLEQQVESLSGQVQSRTDEIGVWKGKFDTQREEQGGLADEVERLRSISIRQEVELQHLKRSSGQTMINEEQSFREQTELRDQLDQAAATITELEAKIRQMEDAANERRDMAETMENLEREVAVLRMGGQDDPERGPYVDLATELSNAGNAEEGGQPQRDISRVSDISPNDSTVVISEQAKAVLSRLQEQSEQHYRNIEAGDLKADIEVLRHEIVFLSEMLSRLVASENEKHESKQAKSPFTELLAQSTLNSPLQTISMWTVLVFLFGVIISLAAQQNGLVDSSTYMDNEATGLLFGTASPAMSHPAAPWLPRSSVLDWLYEQPSLVDSHIS